MNGAILDLGPDADPRFGALIQSLQDHGMPIDYVIGPIEALQSPGPCGAYCQSLSSAMSGGVFTIFWNKVPSQEAQSIEEVTECRDQHVGATAVIERYYGRSDTGVAAGCIALAQWSAYWRLVLDALGSRLVYFHDTPHTIYSLGLFFAAKRLGVPVAILRHTSLDGLSYLCCDLIASLQGGLRTGAHPTPDRLKGIVARDIESRRLPYGLAEPVYMRNQRQTNRSPERDLFLRAFHWAARNMDLRSHFVRDNAKCGTRLSEPRQNMREGLSFPRALTAGSRLHRKSTARPVTLMLDSVQKRRLINAYTNCVARSRSRIISGRAQYLLLWHYQPERTTAPEAGRWLSMARIAAECCEALPPDAVLLIKEHSTQLHVGMQGHIGREPSIYRELLDYDPRIAFVDIGAQTFDLADQARGIVTATGTVGWEALARGHRRVLCSPGAWYQGLPGTASLASKSTVSRFFSEEATTATPAKAIEELSDSLMASIEKFVDVPRRRSPADGTDPSQIRGEAGRLARALTQIASSGH